jgi:hypothetical protein
MTASSFGFFKFFFSTAAAKSSISKFASGPINLFLFLFAKRCPRILNPPNNSTHIHLTQGKVYPSYPSVAELMPHPVLGNSEVVAPGPKPRGAKRGRKNKQFNHCL